MICCTVQRINSLKEAVYDGLGTGHECRVASSSWDGDRHLSPEELELPRPACSVAVRTKLMRGNAHSTPTLPANEEAKRTAKGGAGRLTTNLNAHP